ncbi:MAG: galactose-1-phosphate uridylyltransferase [Actinobacteria bacterium]|nr:galactose-1-phosphate uridylyltransferase [Actinomycetota bacterium]
MLELRYDPIKNKLVAIATKRQDRTFLPPKDYCPLCPTKSDRMVTEIPASNYDIVVFENKFPTFSKNPDKLDFNDEVNSENILSYSKMRSKGICEVVCYTADHDLYLEDLPLEKINNLVNVWRDRYLVLGKKEFIKYVFIFENKGKEIGVTLSHPHGQIYAFPYIPPIALEELRSSQKFYRKNKKCLHCEIIKKELKDKERIIIENKDFIAFIPFYARWPYEVHIYCLRHLGSLCELDDREVTSLSKIIKELVNRYNKLFKFRMPYVMIIHQKPTDNKNYDYYHFHFEFYPPYRTKNKLKYLAGCELGAGTFINDTLPEEKAAELRSIILEK